MVSRMVEMKKAMSPLERHLLECSDMVYIRGKRGRKVPVIIPDDAQNAMKILNEKREEYGIENDNIYFFADSSNYACFMTFPSLLLVINELLKEIFVMC